MIDKINLIDLEKKGLQALRENKFQDAIKIFEKIIELRPDYEHGMVFYDMACALEDIGEFQQAKEAYETAIQYVPNDHIRLGGYASFLYLHDNADKAFKAYLDLLKIYTNDKDDRGISSCYQALFTLGGKMGLQEKEVVDLINKDIPFSS